MRVYVVAGLLLALAQPVSGGVTPAKGLPPTRCPGGFWAHQFDVGGARTVWTTAFEDKDKKDKWWPASGSMGVHVVVKFVQTPAQSLEFSVSYLAPGGSERPSNPGAKNGPELQKSYSLATHDKSRVEGDLLVGPSSTITRVRLISATFADESVWHAASENACSVEPDRLLAVDGKESSLKW